MTIAIRRLGADDLPTMRGLNDLFGRVFDDPAYGAHAPDDVYLSRTLAKDHVLALVAADGGELIGGLVAYELDKLEQARREIYIYDLAVLETHRRRGVATMLIKTLKELAARRGVWAIYVQADYGDDPAVALYTKLGVRENVMHFDIAVPAPASAADP